MTWPLALVLIAALLVGGVCYVVREWRRVQVANAIAEQGKAAAERAKAHTTALLSNNMRAAAERIERHIGRIEGIAGIHKSDNLAPVSPERATLIKSDVVIPFGRKQTEQPTDGGVA